MKKIIITGASGFIGRNTINPLIKYGYDIHAIYYNKKIDINGLIWHKVNLLDHDQVNILFKTVQPSHLLHLAWDVIPGNYLYNSNNYAWLNSGINLLRSFKENGGKRAVVAGTQAEYYSNYPYSACKRALLEVLKSLDISYAWGRIFNLYGENEYSTRLIPSIITSILKGEEIICSSGEQIRDYMYVKDVAEAFVEIVNCEIQGIIDIGSGQGIKVKDIIYKITEKMNGHELIKLGTKKTSLNEVSHSIADISRLKNEVGFLPQFTIDDGLEQVIKWHRLKNN
ncbi:MAG: hypothetical protein A2Y25_01645 [Candidatus Melainabacteria bacterium GWF2_37_15]|nr:MAG: hypothetical protein A2Y25_01645 [Candidatus Melainabacteria bacterium GWF2_37_15]